MGASGSPRGWLRSDGYGFTWGTALVAVAVRRVASFRRDRRDPGDALVLAASIEAPADGPAGWHSPKRLHALEVYVSPTGRSVRVFLDGEELRRG